MDDAVAEGSSTSDHELLSAAFNQIFVASGGVRNQLDVVSSLKLWILLNRENVSQSDESVAGTSSSGDSPAILLSQEAIEHILKGLSKISAMDVGDWITVLRSLKWLSSPRWLLVEAVAENDCRMQYDPEAQGSSSNRQDAPQRGQELADEMCAGTVIHSPHLTRILYNYISGAVYFLYKFRGN